MNRLVIARVMIAVAASATIVFAAGCSGAPKSDAKTGPAIYAKRVAVSWGIQPASGGADVFLQTTDETGKQQSFPLGNFKGTCKVFVPPAEMSAISGVTCAESEGGPALEIHAVAHDDQIVVMRMRTQPGERADPMARDEVTRVRVPGGAKIEAGS